MRTPAVVDAADLRYLAQKAERALRTLDDPKSSAPQIKHDARMLVGAVLTITRNQPPAEAPTKERV